MKNRFLSGSLSLAAGGQALRYKRNFRRQHPEYFDPDGLLVFCGPQGSGKTLSAVQYCKHILSEYPACKFVTNVEIQGLPETTEVLHLEFNSLESKSISIEEMTEFAQQRKQRKHIVGTSQVFMRLAKPLREQIKRVIICQNYFGLIQHNIEIDGTTAVEENGKLKADTRGQYWWVHSPEMYSCYDTYAKMHRYKKEWGGRKVASAALPYDPSGGPQRLKRGPRL